MDTLYSMCCLQHDPREDHHHWFHSACHYNQCQQFYFLYWLYKLLPIERKDTYKPIYILNYSTCIGNDRGLYNHTCTLINIIKVTCDLVIFCTSASTITRLEQFASCDLYTVGQGHLLENWDLYSFVLIRMQLPWNILPMIGNLFSFWQAMEMTQLMKMKVLRTVPWLFVYHYFQRLFSFFYKA